MERLIKLALIALAALVCLAACGGGDDEEPTCYVEGKPMPPDACT